MVIQPSSLSDHDSIRAGLNADVKLPELISPHWPMPSVPPWVSYKSGNPKPCPVSCATVPIGMICDVLHEDAPPTPRSEERRVGKECSSRGLPEDYKKIALRGDHTVGVQTSA